ncbi:alpha/beta hydrolase [Frigoriflavimonas asaccharolytica]|uniref:Alpha/beta hydrolase n=1 Tax=Frigoriflavimonas asaccharolytica TaxID=2735899 RepID=A0A8J8K597_9FLAO|nr:alpha/beta hydrolase [Frigoriflavimonas asaccharolytica]NRS92580.1 hypothetical protein [Frigoriflavimonas asaccharolytica]
MKIYLVSGLGGDHKILEKLKFPEDLEVVNIPWLIPKQSEPFPDYVARMAENIDDKEPFYLLGYSFGGIIVQEIHKLKPADKVVILGSIKSHTEKSIFLKTGEVTKITHFFPKQLFTEKSTEIYAYFRKLLDPKNPKIFNYFTVRDPYYLKWSVEKVADWKSVENPDVIQVMADKDMVFPIKNSKPDYVIKNGTHLFPATKYKEVSLVLQKIFS